MSSNGESRDSGDLRRRAEALVESPDGAPDSVPTPAQALRLVHELRVQHIELELQNEQLRATQLELEHSRARYFELYELAPLGYLVLAADGRILESNLTMATMLGTVRSQLVGGLVERYVLATDRAIYCDFQSAVFKKRQMQVCEVRMVPVGSEPFWARMNASTDGPGQSPVQWRLAVTDITVERGARDLARSFSQRLIAAREKERRLVATALHHDLGSLSVGVEARLFGLGNLLQEREDEEGVEVVAECRSILRETVGRIRRIALDVRPPDVDLLGPAEALRVYCQRCCDSVGVSLSFSDTAGGSSVSEESANVLFRCGQEAVNNVLRHSGATQLDVTVSLEGQRVRVRVADRGSGFDVEFKEKSERTMGLATMREMCHSVGGRLDIVSNPVSGTVVLVSVPMEP